MNDNMQHALAAAATHFDANGAIVHTLQYFIGQQQLLCMQDGMRGEEGQYFTDKIIEVAQLIETMPKVYEQDGKGDQAIVHLHYFTGGADWYITERDMELSEQHQAFGHANLYGDEGELGYISIAELIALGAELDLHWTAKTLAAVKGGK